MLTPLQRQIIDLIRELPEAEGFARAGGAALIVRDLVQRETHHLDYFAIRGEAVHRLARTLERRSKALLPAGEAKTHHGKLARG